MTPLDRIALWSRLFCLAASILLAALTGDLMTIQFALLLGIVGMGTWWASYGVLLRHDWPSAAEALVVGLIMGMAADGHPQVLPYLLAPPLIAGLAGGVFPLLGATVAASFGSMLVTLDRLSGEDFAARAELIAPWTVISLGAGLLGAWLREIGLGPTATSVDRSYESARRLVSLLRTVARRLSSGLDPVVVAHNLQSIAIERLSLTRSVVFVHTEGGLLSPLAYQGDAREALRPDDPLVKMCWEEAEPIVGRVDGNPSNESAWRTALPLRVGARMFGLILGDSNHRMDPVSLANVMRDVDEIALRLETALAFDEVRALAAVEERNRLAREIHDGIAQEIASIGYAVDDLVATADSGDTKCGLENLRTDLTRIVSELRLSIFDLRNDTGAAASLGTALSDYIQQVGARSKMTVHLTLDEAPNRLRGDVENELLRIVQEAVTNARKHASATNLWVDCRIHPPAAHISVRDDGVGLGTGRADSYGLAIMRERAERIGAELDVRASEGTHPGTVVTVVVGENTLGGGERRARTSDRTTR